MGIKTLFDRHHSLERFGVSFLLVFVLMVAMLGRMTYVHIQNNIIQLSDQAVYTRSFSTSKTNTVGSVVNVYGNKERTKVFLLLHFEDMSQIPIVAEQYQMFMAGSNTNQTYSRLKSAPSGGLYVFGSTGYMGVYLVDVGGFHSQICALTLRSLSTASMIGATRDLSPSDPNNVYDQAMIYFNPGANGVRHAQFLESDVIDVFSMFEEVIGRPREAEIRQQLRTDLETMLIQQRSAADYLERLRIENVASPTIPEWMNGDVIEARNKDGEVLSWLDSSKGWSDGKTLYYLEDIRFKYTPAVVLPGGYDFDWEAKSVSEGYLDDLVGDKTVSAYFAGKAQELEKNLDNEVVVSQDRYSYTDGSVVDMNEETGNRTIISEIKTLQSIFEAYYDAKYDYQVTQLGSLLSLEDSMHNIGKNYTTNYSEDTLTLY